jgi:hypothetical protein
MRAREPDREGFVDRDGVRLHYEVFGDGEPTLVLVPSNPIVHSRQWKAQVTMAGAGHMLPARHPVKVNLLIRDFIDHLSKPGQRTRSTTTGRVVP